MRKVLLTLLAVNTLAFAQPYTKEDRIKDMQDMAEAMNTIQSGFFYNNFDTVAGGVEALTTAVEKVKPPVEETSEKDFMTRYMNRKYQMTDKIVKKINKKSIDILDRFKTGDSTQAVQAYTKILGQCMKCHRETRSY